MRKEKKYTELEIALSNVLHKIDATKQGKDELLVINACRAYDSIKKELDELKKKVREYFKIPPAGTIFVNPLEKNAQMFNLLRLAGEKDE